MTIPIVDGRRRRQRLGSGPGARPFEGRFPVRDSRRGPLAAYGTLPVNDGSSHDSRPTGASSPMRRTA